MWCSVSLASPSFTHHSSSCLDDFSTEEMLGFVSSFLAFTLHRFGFQFQLSFVACRLSLRPSAERPFCIFAFSLVYAIRFREFWIIFGKVYIIIHLKSLPNIVLPSSSKLNKIRIISSVLPIFFCSREVKLVRFSVQSTCESCLVCWCFFLCYFCAVCDYIVLIIIYWLVWGFVQVWFFDPSFRWLRFDQLSFFKNNS